MNQVTLEGTAERNAEYKLSKTGKGYTTLRLRTEEEDGFKDYHTVVAFGNDADTLALAVEGVPVRIEGKMKTSSFTGDDGVKKSVTKVVASSVKILSRTI